MFLCALSAAASTHFPVTEKIEWTWTDRPEAPQPNLPNVLLVGDSITRGYYPAVVKDLADTANVYLFATSCSSGDARLPGQLHDYFNMMDVKFTVVHFNNGMHGWGYTESQYAAGLPGMIAALRAGAPQAMLLWASTTPLLHDPVASADAPTPSSNARVDARNHLAAGIMAKEHIVTDDQHALMLQHQDSHSGDVHFTEEGSAIQASQVAQAVRRVLPMR
jgi:hypothetical protein